MNEQNKDSEEISLIDLFAVLLRYRVLICIIMVIAVIGTGAGYFVQSQRREKIPSPVKKCEFKMAIGPAPGTKYLLAEQRLSLYFSYPEVIRAVLNDAPQNPPKPDNVRQWIPAPGSINAEERNFAASNGKLTFREILRSGVLEVTYKTDDGQDGFVFLKSLFTHGKEALEKNIIPLARTYIETYEESQKNAQTPNVESENYIMVKALLDGKTASVAELFDPYVLEIPDAPKKSYIKTALVILFAAFFLAIFLAFSLNALKNIKNDQEAMQKLRDALIRK